MLKKFTLQDAPIAPECRAFGPSLSIAGLQYRLKDARRFVRAKNPVLEFRLEGPRDQFPGSVRIYGVWKSLFKTVKVHLGYLPAESREILDAAGLKEAVTPRLSRLYEGGDGFIDINFQIIGPKDRWKEYQSARKSVEASRPADYGVDDTVDDADD